MSTTDEHKKSLGRVGEGLAAEFLEKEGYKVVTLNYRPPKWGEIDIIAVDGDTLVFVEVKTRVGDQMLEPYESVNSHKLRAIKRTAWFFIRETERELAQSKKSKDQLPQAYRLDFVSVHYPTADALPQIELFKNIEEF